MITKTPSGWRVDVKQGSHKRFRRTFIYKDDAEKFELQKKVEHQQQKTFGRSDVRGKTLIGEVISQYQTYAEGRHKNFKQGEFYRLEGFKKFFGDRYVGDVSKVDGDRFFQKMIDQKKEIGTLNRYRTSLRSLFNWTVERGYVNENPFAKLPRWKGDNKRVRWLTHEEVRGLIKTAEDNGDEELGNLVRIGVHTGFRKANLKELLEHPEHIQSEVVTALKTKSGKPYDVPHIGGLREVYGDISREWGVNLRKRFMRVVRLAGLYTSSKDPNRVTLHTLRHTFAAHCLQAGVPIYTVSQWLGHSSVAITQNVYGHLSKNHSLEEAKKVPVIGQSDDNSKNSLRDNYGTPRQIENLQNA